MKFRRRATTVEAMQWDGTWEGASKIQDVFDSRRLTLSDMVSYIWFYVESPEGDNITISPSDWVIKEEDGTVYPCTERSMKQFYTLVVY